MEVLLNICYLNFIKNSSKANQGFKDTIDILVTRCQF